MHQLDLIEYSSATHDILLQHQDLKPTWVLLHDANLVLSKDVKNGASLHFEDGPRNKEARNFLFSYIKPIRNIMIGLRRKNVEDKKSHNVIDASVSFFISSSNIGLQGQSSFDTQRVLCQLVTYKSRHENLDLDCTIEPVPNTDVKPEYSQVWGRLRESFKNLS